jgi:glycosyltransferase involved in cell wall biosynthesis
VQGNEAVPVTVVVPVRDEAATIDALLDSLAAQTTPPQQVVVVDGGSTDGTLQHLHRRASADPTMLVVDAGPATPGRGRNLGIAAAACDWIALTDAGIRVEPTWLEHLWAAHLRASQARIVYGNYEFDLRSTFERRAAVAYGEPKVPTSEGPCRGPSVVSVLVHRSVVEEVGGFLDSRSGEDEAFTRAVRAAGVQVAWAPDATVWWRLRPDLRSTAERFRLYSYHYALAGEQRHWQLPLARAYLPVVAGLALSARSRLWLALPVGTLAARTAKRYSRQPEELRPHGAVAALSVAAIVLATDSATFLGWAQALRDAQRRSGR